MKAESVGFIGTGVFTIIKEAQEEIDNKGTLSRWGYLRTGKGLICLDYAEKAA